MNPSSISFSNEASQHNIDRNNCAPKVSVHEFALHAMRDRCLLLQRRINTLEKTNMRLKLDLTNNSEKSNNNKHNQDEEKYLLEQKIFELKKHNSHLAHNLFMVSCENKNLWRRLGGLKTIPVASGNKESAENFVFNSNIACDSSKANTNYEEKFHDSSLEEISLKFINNYLQEKSQLVEQYEQMAQLQETNQDILDLDSIAFQFNEDPVTDSLKEIQNQALNNLKIQKEISEQEKKLKMIISRVENVLKGYKCPSCPAKVETENKDIETSASLGEWVTPVNSNLDLENSRDLINPIQSVNDNQIYEENDDLKRGKICPVCGQGFQKHFAFSDFQLHVENHFIES